ncbi:unnamed protein product [Tilletia controversa]|nr:unnamed protein product [Tilletia controversa]
MMVWGNLVAFVLLASTAALVEAKPTTSTSCYTVRVSGTRTLTSSLPPQTRRPTITTCPVVKSTVTVTRPRTSTNVVSSISTVRVTAAVTSITQTITPTVFTLTVPTITSQAPRFTPTETQILIAPSPGTFTSTTTTFTNPPGPTLAVAPPRRAVGDKAEDDGEIEERDGGCNDGEELVLDRRAGKNITPGNAQSEALRLKGKRVYCRRIVRLDPKTVAGTRTRTATIRTTVRPRTTVTSTVTATATSTVYNTAAGVFVPTLVVPRLRNAFCGPLARPFNSNNFGVSDPTTQQLNFITPSAGQTCCDAAANIPGAVGYDNFNGVCAVVQISGTPTAQFCVAGNPATALVRDAICDATCSPGGLLQCGA